MQSAIICDQGFENVVLKDLLKNHEINSKINETYLVFDADQLKLAELCYCFQSAIKVLGNVFEFKVNKNINENDFKDILENFEKSVFDSNYNFEKFKVNCVRKGDHNFSSVDLANKISQKIFKNKVKDFKNPNIEIFIYVKDDLGLIGVDYSGRTLSKRDYKIFLGANTLRATIAYNLIALSDVKKNEVVLDPFMGSGTIPIEAGLYFSKTSPFFFSKEKFNFIKFINNDWNSWFKKIDDKRDISNKPIYGFDSLLKFLKHSQKNAKIADINKVINLSKVEIDWIDTKVDEKSVDKIITHPPIITENKSKSKIIKIYKDLFNRSKEILKSNGEITIISTPVSISEIIKIGEDNNFKLFEKMIVYEGKQEMQVARFKIDK